MKNTPSSISLCRHCQYYFPEGRRGGHCQKLNVAVQSKWNACNLATPPFISPWEKVESLALWKQRVLLQQESVALAGVVAEDSDSLERSFAVTPAQPPAIAPHATAPATARAS